MRKIIILIMFLFLMTGCVNINTSNIDEIINEAVTSKKNIYNSYRKGYKYYLPVNAYVENSKNYNEVIKTKENTLYLYIDIISYLNKTKSTYKKNTQSYLSQNINYKDKDGYIEINKIKDKYLVEIMYNYAKIEVMVNSNQINNIVADSIIILSSIYYNKDIISNLSKDNILNYHEENIDIFSTKKNNNNKFHEYKDVIEDEKSVIPDYDMIN